MSKTAKSILFFSFYMIAVALILIFLPGLILRILNIPDSGSILVRFMGMTVLFIGYLYLRAGLSEKKLRGFYTLTLHTRFSALIILVLFTIILKANPIIILFGVIDSAGAVWTIVSMRKDKSAEKPIEEESQETTDNQQSN